MTLEHHLRAWWERRVERTAHRQLAADGVTLGEGVRLYGMPIVTLAESSSVEVGDRVVLCSDSRWTDLGVNHPVVLRTLRPAARISIGSDCGISGGSICAALSVTIGEGTLVGANVTIVDTDFHPLDSPRRRHEPLPEPRPEDRVEIGANVFLGTGAVVLKGSTIEDDAVVGAGAVVSGHVPAGARVAGSPARVLGDQARRPSG